MPANLPPKLGEALTRLRQTSGRVLDRLLSVSEQGWAGSKATSRATLIWAREASRICWTAAKAGSQRGWTSFRDSWTNQDWMAGIKPLPVGMAGNLTAIAIVTGLMLTSLVYGDHHERQIASARLIPSGEHPSQILPAPSEPQPETPAVPEPAIPDAAPSPGPAVALPQIGEAFVEHFDNEELDERWFVSDGWSNGDWMENDWRRSQVEIVDGGLRLTLGKGPPESDHPLSSGEIRTHAFYRYGYFEARMKTPGDPGMVAGMFTYADKDGAKKPNEIDIEILGRAPRTLEATIHENGKPTHKKVSMPFDSSRGFHTYGIEWRPDVVRWYLDGKMVHEVAGGAAARLTRPQQYIFSLWGSHKLKDWLGPLNESKAPWTLELSCVGYTPRYTGESLCD